MDPNSNVEPVVMAEEGVSAEGTQEFAQPETQLSDKELNFRALESERDRYRSDYEDFRRRAEQAETMVTMYKNMGTQPAFENQQPTQRQQTPGINFSDAVDAEHFDRLSGYVNSQAEAIKERTAKQAEQMQMLELQVLDKDWRGTINKYLPDAIKETPWIAEEIKSSPDMAWKRAYHYATHSTEYLQDKIKGQRSKEAERMISNAEKPRTLASTGPQSNVGTERDAFDMSPEEFEAVKKRLVAGKL